MKLLVGASLDNLILEVKTTDKEIKEFSVPNHHIHYWYPFNVNFMYAYSSSKEMLYLVKEKNYDGPNYYNTVILKKAKPLEEKNGTMFNREVFKRNFYIMGIANRLGISTIDRSYTLDDVQEGFDIVRETIEAIKYQIQKRISSENGDEMIQFLPSEEFDKEIYCQMTAEEQEALIEMGEIYSMLNVMRKIAEVE